MVEVKQKVYFNTLQVEISEGEYTAEIDIELGSFEPFSMIYASNGKENLLVSLSKGNYGYFIKINDLTYFIKFRDFNVSTDMITQKAKEGYDSLKNYIQQILSKGKVIRKRE